MIVARRPFSRLDRTAAAVLAIVLIGAGIATFALSLASGRFFLAWFGLPVIGVGVMNAIAAWRGRPLGPR